MDPIFEDTTVYVLDSKLDATFPVPPSQHLSSAAAAFVAADAGDRRLPSAS